MSINNKFRSNNNNNYLLYILFSGLIVLIITLVGCLFWLKSLYTLQVQSSNQRYNSYRIANELRRSSDDLTTMVRLYIITKNKMYLDHFNEILSIRNGSTPRPERYDDVYWDLILDSNKRPRPYKKPQSIVSAMIDNNFSLREFDLLRQSQELSNTLAAKEMQAMEIIQANGDQQKAIDLVFGKEYLEAKAKIMLPIEHFMENVYVRTTDNNAKIALKINHIILFAIILSLFSTLIIFFSIYKALHTISVSAKENELLLLNILPSSIAERLKNGEESIADEFPQASVLFCDIVGFTSMTEKIGTVKMFDLLGHLFDALDTLAFTYGVEKIKTIGDSYMAVSGVPEPRADHAIRLADFALSIKEKVKELSNIYKLDLQIRIGMTYGVVVAGVIGHNKFIYDVWGEVVNIASRMESTSIPGEIQITEKMAYLLEELFLVVKNKEIVIKGKGKMQTYFLKERKP